MNRLHLSFVASAFFFTVSCAPPPARCSPTTCASGCCSATGTCETGTVNSACGRGGLTCSACSLTDTCNAGTCTPNSSTGGGFATGGGSAGGSTAGGSTAGGSTAGGSTAGGSTAGGSTAGGSTAGGSTAGGSTAGGSTAGGSTAGGTAPGVSGLISFRRVLVDAGTITTPANLSSATVAALVANGSTYDVYAGSGLANGSYTVPGVPAGDYLLQINGLFFETDLRNAVVFADTMGRAEGTVATVNPTNANISITGLQPWSTGADLFAWYNPHVDTELYLSEASTTPAITSGGTSTTLSIGFANRALTDTSRGDQPWLMQYRYVNDGGTEVAFVRAATQVTPLVHQNGQTANVNVAMQPPSSFVQSFNWNLNAFAQLQPTLPPGTRPTGRLSFRSSPGDRAFVGVFELWTLGIPASFSPIASATIPTPFPTNWTSTGRVDFTVDTFRQVAGTTGPLATLSGLGHIDSLAAITSGPITPRLGAVASVQLNGAFFTADVTGAGVTPLLSWLPPTLGTPSFYEVVIRRLSTLSTAPTTVAEEFTFRVTRTSLRVPQDLLISGQPYSVTIVARQSPENVRQTFFFGAVPNAFSYVQTPIFRP